MPDACAIAREWIGTPFIGGCWPAVKLRGADCGSFIAGVLSEAGVVELPAMTKYDWCGPWAKGGDFYLCAIRRHAQEISLAERGAIALFHAGRGWSHAAIVLDWPAVIHADRRQGVVMASARCGWLKGRQARFFRPHQEKSE